MAVIAFSPVMAMKAASLTDLSQAYPRVLPSVEVDVESESEATIDTSDVEGDADVSVNEGSSVSTEEMVVTREDLSLEQSSNVEVSLDGVATEEDLRIYALSAVRADENVNSISFGGDEITVSYKTGGHFIGIIPMDMSVDVRVNQEGEVSLDYPWYGFLVVKDDADLEASLQAEVDAAMGERVAGGWTNYDRADLAASIAAALKAHYGAATE